MLRSAADGGRRRSNSTPTQHRTHSKSFRNESMHRNEAGMAAWRRRWQDQDQARMNAQPGPNDRSPQPAMLSVAVRSGGTPPRQDTVASLLQTPSPSPASHRAFPAARAASPVPLRPPPLPEREKDSVASLLHGAFDRLQAPRRSSQPSLGQQLNGTNARVASNQHLHYRCNSAPRPQRQAWSDDNDRSNATRERVSDRAGELCLHEVRPPNPFVRSPSIHRDTHQSSVETPSSANDAFEAMLADFQPGPPALWEIPHLPPRYQGQTAHTDDQFVLDQPEAATWIHTDDSSEATRANLRRHSNARHESVETPSGRFRHEGHAAGTSAVAETNTNLVDHDRGTRRRSETVPSTSRRTEASPSARASPSIFSPRLEAASSVHPTALVFSPPRRVPVEPARSATNERDISEFTNVLLQRSSTLHRIRESLHQQWACSQCTFLNSTLLRHCEMCEAPRSDYADSNRSDAPTRREELSEHHSQIRSDLFSQAHGELRRHMAAGQEGLERLERRTQRRRPVPTGQVRAPRLAVTTWSYSMKESECAICIANFEPGNPVSTLSCGHTFHAECIGRWLASREGAPCPLCRCIF